MENDLAIKLDYLPNRQNPSEVFEAMALYIDAYRDFGQLLTTSIGIKADFEFKLVGIDTGSILSLLKAPFETFDKSFRNASFSCGEKLFERLTKTDVITDESEVEALAVELEAAFAKKLEDQISDPYIDRKALAFILSKLSTANQKTMPGESVSVLPRDGELKAVSVNTKWRFNGDPRTMFSGKTVKQEFTDRLYVHVTVNEGDNIWIFKSVTSKRKFTARIAHKEWLDKYQKGLIPPIGPNDVVEANLSYEVYTPRKGKNKGIGQIRNAKILKVISIDRSSAYQSEL